MSGDRRSAPHVARNAGPIADVLRTLLPPRGLVLEIASGSGEHALHFAREFPHLLFQPSDPEPAALRSIDAWRAEAGLFNLLPPLALDARGAEWPVAAADAILCINMVHISPWAATVGLMRGAGRLLAPGRAALSLRRLPPGRGRDRAQQRGVRREPEGARSGLGPARPGGGGSGGREEPAAAHGRDPDAGEQPVRVVPPDLTEAGREEGGIF